MDEKRLDELKRLQSGWLIQGSPAHFSPREVDEIIRLAKHGLWAEKHGIPAMRDAREELDGFYSKASLEAGIYTVSKEDVDLWFGRDRIDQALAALPKEEK